VCNCSGYPLNKIQENNEAEIMQTVLEEAQASYAQDIVVELQSETPEDMDSNVDRMLQWVQNWRKDRGLSEQPENEEQARTG
jgi:adenylate kinase